MIKYLLILIMFLSSNAFGWEPLKIELENKNNNLRLYLISVNAGRGVLINKRLGFGPADGISEVTLEILDKEGKEFPYSPLVDINSLREQDIITLYFHDIIGREFITKELIKSYSLEPGIYKARATYKNKDKYWADKDVYNDSLTSNWVTFEVTESDMINIYGKNWRKIKQNALRKRREVEEHYKKLEKEWKEKNKKQ